MGDYGVLGHLTAVKFINRKERKQELCFRHSWIVDALGEDARFHAESGTESRVRRPITCGVLLTGAFSRLHCALRFFFLAPSCEIFANKEVGRTEGHMFRRGCHFLSGRYAAILDCLRSS